MTGHLCTIVTDHVGFGLERIKLVHFDNTGRREIVGILCNGEPVIKFDAWVRGAGGTKFHKVLSRLGVGFLAATFLVRVEHPLQQERVR